MRISDWSSDVCSSDLSIRSACRVEWKRPKPATGVKPPLRRAPMSAHRETERTDHRMPPRYRSDLLPDAVSWVLTGPERIACRRRRADRTSVVEGTSVSVRVALGGRRIMKKKHERNYRTVSNKVEETN